MRTTGNIAIYARPRIERTACSVLFALVFATSVSAQESAPTSTLADQPFTPPPTAELIKGGAKFAVETAADVLGMVRLTGPQRTTSAINKLEFTGAGTMARQAPGGTWINVKVSTFTAGMDYVIPASRIDATFIGADGRQEREIRVVAGKQAWNEEEPGINGVPMPQTVDDRLREMWLTPHGAMWGALRAVDAGGKVTLADDGGRLAVSYVVNGEPITIVFDAELRPQRVQLEANSATHGKTVLEATFSGYKDFEGYLTLCPTRIEEKAGGRAILALNIRTCSTNPYVIFPLPANMRPASTK